MSVNARKAYCHFFKSEKRANLARCSVKGKALISIFMEPVGFFLPKSRPAENLPTNTFIFNCSERRESHSAIVDLEKCR